MVKHTRNSREYGFTLIELMIVIAILAILLSIAVPTFHNYSVRAQNSECLSIAAPAKTFVAESAQAQGVTIDSDTANLGGWVPPAATDLCSSVQIADGTGVITVTTNVAGSSGQFILTPSQASSTNTVEWGCTAPGVPANQTPATCRGS